jgi:hypothetical protein
MFKQLVFANCLNSIKKNMENKEMNQKKEVVELPDSWWYRVYLAVIITTIIVISLLWFFSQHFSN